MSTREVEVVGGEFVIGVVFFQEIDISLGEAVGGRLGVGDGKTVVQIIETLGDALGLGALLLVLGCRLYTFFAVQVRIVIHWKWLILSDGDWFLCFVIEYVSNNWSIVEITGIQINAKKFAFR